MFKALFYPRQVKFYTDNVRASVTNSMSDSNCKCHIYIVLHKVVLLLVIHRVLPITSGQFPSFPKPFCCHDEKRSLMSGLGKHEINWPCLRYCQPPILLLGAVQCSAVQCSAVQCREVQCSAVQCSAVQGSF